MNLHKYAFYGIVFFGLAFVLFSISLLSSRGDVNSIGGTSNNYIEKSVSVVQTDNCIKFDVYMDRLCGVAYSREELNGLLLNVFTGRTICKSSGVLTVYCYPIGSTEKQLLYSNQIVDLNNVNSGK